MTSSIRKSATEIIVQVSVAAAMLWPAGAAANAQSALTAAAAAATAPTAIVTQLYNAENAAIAGRDYAKFVAPGTAAFKKALTKDLFNAACTSISDNLRTGYTSQFAGQKTVEANTLYVWNVTCKNGVQYRAIMGVASGKVSAFLYQPPQPAAKQP